MQAVKIQERIYNGAGSKPTAVSSVPMDCLQQLTGRLHPPSTSLFFLESLWYMHFFKVGITNYYLKNSYLKAIDIPGRQQPLPLGTQVSPDARHPSTASTFPETPQRTNTPPKDTRNVRAQPGVPTESSPGKKRLAAVPNPALGATTGGRGKTMKPHRAQSGQGGHLGGSCGPGH